MHPANKITLEWVKTEDGGMTLIFDSRTWKIFTQQAKAQDKTPEHMIAAAVAQTLGPILMDNYTLNRFLRG